ncbi:MAG: PRC-barrel domain-containing protein [Pseudomonadota bacterium]
MKKLFTSTAVVLAFAMPTFAENYPKTATFLTATDSVSILSSDFVGSRVYVSETELGEAQFTEVNPEWDDIGEVHDIVLSRDGEVEAVLVDVGGFLGLGEKTVAAQMDSLKFISDGTEADEYFVVMTASKASLEAAPEFEVLSATMSSDGYTEISREELTAELLTGSAVYDATDDWIGEVSELVLESDGQISDAIIDVGGFLGIGEKPVALQLDQLSINRVDDGDEVRVYVDMTKEALEALPTYTN